MPGEAFGSCKRYFQCPPAFEDSSTATSTTTTTAIISVMSRRIVDVSILTIEDDNFDNKTTGEIRIVLRHGPGLRLVWK